MPTRLPFNWKTPFGFLIAILDQAVAAYFTLLSTASSLCILVGMSWFFIAFIEDIANDLFVLNPIEIPNRSYQELMEDFSHNIRLYSDVKKLIAKINTIWWSNQINNYIMLFFFRFVNDFNMLYRYVIFAFFLWTLTTIASSLIVLQSESVEYTIRIVSVTFV